MLWLQQNGEFEAHIPPMKDNFAKDAISDIKKKAETHLKVGCGE